MRLQDMQLLVRVAKTGSMTEAGRQLHLSPAAVSSGIRRIEAGLELRLFERTTRSLHPTDEGLVVLRGCQKVLDEWQETLQEARDHHADLSGTVHLSAPSDTAYSILSDVIAQLCVTHPRLRVEVDISDALLHLHRAALDITIRYGSLQDSSLAAQKLVAQPNVLVASPAYLERAVQLVQVDDLHQHRLLTLRLSGQPATQWTLHGPDGVQTVNTRSPLCADGYQVRRWALAGHGIALKHLVDVIDDLEQGRLIRVLPEFTGGTPPIHAVFPSRRSQPARVRALHSAIQAAFKIREQRCRQWLR